VRAVRLDQTRGMPPAPDAAQTRMWTIGDYPVVARHLLPISETVVKALDVQAGEDVLDVGVGDGNAAILAARRGAKVTGVDLTPAQIERARARCAAEQVSVDLRVGDAQRLDLPDESFDVVMSVMGVIFAPDHAAAARELARVCRPSGRLAVTAWTTSGWATTWRTKLAHLVPPTAAGTPSPDEWGEAEEARGRLAAAGLSTKAEQRNFAWRFPSPQEALDTFVTAAGPIVALFEALGPIGKVDEGRTLLLEAIHEANVATDGSCTLPAPYLLITANP
jgi:SAM-dependent methyltransferase